MMAIHGWSSRRRSSCSPEPSAVNDSWGPVVPPRALGRAHAKARESYSYNDPKSSRFRTFRIAKSSGTRGSRRRWIFGNDSRLVGRIGMPAHDDQQGKKAEHVGKAHVPAVIEPAPHRLRFRKHVGERHAGARAEPDHRPAEAHGVGQVAPVVPALLERESRERDVVEDRKSTRLNSSHVSISYAVFC